MFITRLPKTLTILLSLLLFFTAPAYAVKVGKNVVGKEYNDILGRWIERRIGILINDSHDIMIAADTALGQANFFLPSSSSMREELESAVSKALKWSKIAKKNKAEVRKRISCFRNASGFSAEVGENCRWRDHVASDHYRYLAFEFASQEKGKETNLIVTIIGGYNEHKKATIYLAPPEMKQFLRNIQKIDGAMEESYAMEKKEALFN
jgi:hypothetical protein